MSCPPDRYWCSFNLFWIIKKILEKIRGISMAEKLDPKELSI
jgi:hypothetical protein